MSIAEKLTTIAENEQKVYDAGKQAGWDNFWDAFQNYGKRVNYYHTFYSDGWNGGGWTLDNFKPKYDIKPTRASGMFYGTIYLPIDLRPQQFKAQFGVEIDLSNVTEIEQFLSATSITAVGTIDVTNISKRLYYVFFSALKLQLIEKLVLPTTAEPSMNTTGAFNNCNTLTTIEEIEGLFGNSFDIHWSPLGYDTIIRIINALADYSDGSYSKTLTLGADNLAKLTDAEKAIATEKGWTLV